MCLRKRFDWKMRELSAHILTHVEGIYNVFDIFLPWADARGMYKQSFSASRALCFPLLGIR